MKWRNRSKFSETGVLYWWLRCIFCFTLFISSSSAYAAKAACNNFSLFVLSNFLNENISATANLLLFEDAKKVVETCPDDFFEKAKPRFVFSKAAYDKKIRDLPDRVIMQIADPKETPYAVLDGEMGRSVQTLKKLFTLTPAQSTRLNLSIRQALERTKTLLSDVDKNCERIDFRSRLPSVPDQVKSSLCYAHTLAAEIGFAAEVSDVKNDPVSAAGIALVYQMADAKKKQDSLFKDGPTSDVGGKFEDALAAVKQFGVCRESQISNEFQLIKKPSSVKDYARVFPKLSQKQIAEAIGPDPWVTIGRLVSLACPKPISLSYLKSDSKEVETWQEKPILVKGVQEYLQSGRLVGFSNSSLFGHAMTIVGQKYNSETKMCDFIVRNSYGKNCGRKTGSNFAKIVKRCDEKGNFLISSAMLIENISEIHRIEPKQTPDAKHVDPATK